VAKEKVPPHRPRVIVDCDQLVYACGFAAEKEKNDLTGEVILQPLNHCLSTVRTSLESLIKRYEVQHNDTHFFVYLTGKGNFRDTLATILPYKGNRKELKKPAYYEDIREYLVKHWDARVVDGMEADDAVCIEYNKEPENSVIVSQDKDLLQLPGWHFNPRKEEHTLITPAQGRWNLWQQVITGDRIDNILGIPGIGPKKAAKALYTALGAHEGPQELPSHSFGLKAAREAYRGFYRDRGCPTQTGDYITWEKALEETLGLVYLLRFEGDTYHNVLREGGGEWPATKTT